MHQLQLYQHRRFLQAVALISKFTAGDVNFIHLLASCYLTMKEFHYQSAIRMPYNRISVGLIAEAFSGDKISA